MPVQTRSWSKKAEMSNASKPNPINKHVKKQGKDMKQVMGDVGKRYNESDAQGRHNIDEQYLVNGKPPNGSPSNGEPPNGQPPNNQPPNGEPPNDEPPNAQPPNNQPPNGEPPNGEPPNAQPPNNQPPNGEPPNGHPPNAQPPNNQPPNGEPPNGHPPNAEPPNAETPDSDVKRRLKEIGIDLASPDVREKLDALIASYQVPDVKMEGDESLFVPQAQDTEDPEDVYNIIGPNLHSHDELFGNEEEMGYFVGPFGRVYQIVRQGIIGRSKYVARWAPQTIEDLQSGNYSLCEKRTITKDKKNQKISSLQGVAWAYNEHEKSYLQSIAPKTWTKEKSREIGELSERRRPPALKIKVKWQDGETSWETRTIVKKHWPQSGPNGPRYKVTIEEPVKYGDLIILDVGDTIENADLAMVKTAIRCEQNYANLLEERENTPQMEPDSTNNNISSSAS